ncbi:MAG: hypothetical protein Q7K33_04350 [Candidatus Berkelbacteria bacterium]|nr:hypothetical protein [Candidatus Berkelbacteria bacterium]
MTKMIAGLLVAAVATFFVIMLPNSGQAQELGQAKVSISPTLFELTAKPGDILENTMKVINTSEIVQSYEMEIKSFIGNELGQAKITASDDPEYALRGWVKITPEKFTLAAKQTQVVKFVISVPEDAEPGGQYGSILASLVDNSTVTGTGAITKPKVGTLVLVAVAGDITYSAYIKEFSVAKKRFERPPVEFRTKIHNSSSVHIKPKGFITLTDIFGRKAGSIDFDQKNILPDSDRLITQSYEQPLIVGRYVATLNVLYGEKGDQLSSKTVFYVFPTWLIILCVALLILIILLLLYRRRQKRRFAVLLRAAKAPRIIRRMS